MASSARRSEGSAPLVGVLRPDTHATACASGEPSATCAPFRRHFGSTAVSLERRRRGAAGSAPTGCAIRTAPDFARNLKGGDWWGGSGGAAITPPAPGSEGQGPGAQAGDVLRPPPRPFGILVAGWLEPDPGPRGARQRAGDAGARPHRSRGDVRSGGFLPGGDAGRHQADHRHGVLSGPAPDDRPRATPRLTSLPSAAAGRKRNGLPQSASDRNGGATGGLLLPPP